MLVSRAALARLFGRMPREGLIDEVRHDADGRLAGLVMVGGLAASAHAAQQRSTPTGHDVSYPQCGARLPSGQAFGVVAVNEGRANTTIPCLAEEVSWAKASTGAARLPKASLYVNTADPGRQAADWPATNYDPITGKHITDPYGRCGGGNSRSAPGSTDGTWRTWMPGPAG